MVYHSCKGIKTANGHTYGTMIQQDTATQADSWGEEISARALKQKEKNNRLSVVHRFKEVRSRYIHKVRWGMQDAMSVSYLLFSFNCTKCKMILSIAWMAFTIVSICDKLGR